jgi:hypothetical protein
LKEIFFDLTSTILDVCFSPDSKGILVLPALHPGFVFMLKLPLIKDEDKSLTRGIHYTTSSTASLYQMNRATQIDFEPRIAGPLSIFGPAVGVFGQTIIFTHIASNGRANMNAHFSSNYPVNMQNSTSNQTPREGFSFVTWNDDGLGEYCLWTIFKNQSDYYFRCFPRLISNVFDLNWLEVGKKNILILFLKKLCLNINFFFFFSRMMKLQKPIFWTLNFVILIDSYVF